MVQQADILLRRHLLLPGLSSTLGATQMDRTYPADPADGALRLFSRWFGAHYARSLSRESSEPADALLRAVLVVGRRWRLAVTVLNTLAPDADLRWEAARAALEQRLDLAGHSLGVWVPRGAPLPVGEPGASQFLVAVDAARRLDDGRLEIRRPVHLYLRRNTTTGSVITILGGLAPHWAQFTNRVPGSYYLNSQELFRLPASQEERDELAERIVLAAGQPTADDSQTIPAEDAWTATELGEGGSCIFGSPKPEDDEQSAALRRNLRRLLREANEGPRAQADATALVVLGAATYAEEEKLSWALRGMDPVLYAGYDILTVIADGVVKPILKPGRAQLPWDA